MSDHPNPLFVSGQSATRHLLVLPTPMLLSAVFCNVPLSSSVDPTSEASLLSLDWVLSSGVPTVQSVASGALTLPSGDSVCSMHIKLRICSDLPYDLVLGRDWLFFCRETLPHASFVLSSGVVTPGRPAGTYYSVLFCLSRVGHLSPGSSHTPAPLPSGRHTPPTAGESSHEHDERESPTFPFLLFFSPSHSDAYVPV